MNLIARISLKFESIITKNKNKYYRDLIIKSAQSLDYPFTVNGKSIINNNTYLGKNVNFNGLLIHGKGMVCIGNNFHSGIGCSIIVSFHRFENAEAIPYDQTTINKDVIIKDNVWLGNNVTILGGITIEEGVIIQAGSVVVSDIPKYAIAGGHPAKVFKYRDKEHYEKLKALSKFH